MSEGWYVATGLSVVLAFIAIILCSVLRSELTKTERSLESRIYNVRERIYDLEQSHKKGTQWGHYRHEAHHKEEGE